MISHRRLEFIALTVDASRDRTLDLVIGPGADTLRLALRDVTRHRDPPRTREFKAACAEPGRELASSRTHRGMALHAVCHGREILSFLHLVFQVVIGEFFFAPRRDWMTLRHLIDWVCNFIAYGFQR